MQTKKEVDPLHKPPEFRKVVFFNGPPRCGKSFGADCMRSFVQINAVYMQPRTLDFAEPLKKAAHALFDAFHSWDYYDTKEGMAQKSLACGDFLGMSPREAYISLSEDYLKPKFGEEALGYILRKRIVRYNGTNFFAVSNCGFLPELSPIVDLVGQRNVMIVEVHSAHRTFDEDSRGYVGDAAKAEWPHITVKKLPNVIGGAEDRDFFKMLCQGLVKGFLKIEEKDG